MLCKAYDLRQHLKSLAILFSCILLAGCAASSNWITVPEPLVEEARLAGFDEQIRFWGDARPPHLDKMVSEQTRQLAAHWRSGKMEINMLSISGGGEDGAFGAGLLNGWTQRGNRPDFSYVTGVSTGGLIAPFAFLGPKYDGQLKEVFTTTSTDDVLRQNFISGLLSGTAISDSAPLFALISRYITPELIERIAEQHRKGRRLFIGTTNLEAERPVVWNMGRIANSSNPEKVELFHRILLASASIPGVFPPVPIKVVVDGKAYEEIHVDGGTISQVFLYPSQVDVKQLEKRHRLNERRAMYIIINGKTGPAFEKVQAKTIDIANRALATLIKAQGNGDVSRLYGLARRDRIAFNLAFIPDSFNVPSKEEFDEAYMNALFNEGFRLGKNGYKWHKKPPDS